MTQIDLTVYCTKKTLIKQGEMFLLENRRQLILNLSDIFAIELYTNLIYSSMYSYVLPIDK